MPLLHQADHTAIAPDLPGHGQDRTPIPEITLQSYVQRVCETVMAQAEPVILVGHSLGGVVITQAAEECPDRIKMLVKVISMDTSVVVIPKTHVLSILDPLALDGVLLSSMVRAVQEVARELGLDRTGFYVRTNAAAPGVTPHMHWHIYGPGIP